MAWCLPFWYPHENIGMKIWAWFSKYSSPWKTQVKKLITYYLHCVRNFFAGLSGHCCWINLDCNIWKTLFCLAFWYHYEKWGLKYDHYSANILLLGNSIFLHSGLNPARNFLLSEDEISREHFRVYSRTILQIFERL